MCCGAGENRRRRCGNVENSAHDDLRCKSVAGWSDGERHPAATNARSGQIEVFARPLEQRDARGFPNESSDGVGVCNYDFTRGLSPKPRPAASPQCFALWGGLYFMSAISCPSEPRFTAFVAIDWADRRHVYAWEEAASVKRARSSTRPRRSRAGWPSYGNVSGEGRSRGRWNNHGAPCWRC